MKIDYLRNAFRVTQFRTERDLGNHVYFNPEKSRYYIHRREGEMVLI